MLKKTQQVVQIQKFYFQRGHIFLQTIKQQLIFAGLLVEQIKANWNFYLQIWSHIHVGYHLALEDKPDWLVSVKAICSNKHLKT